MEEGFFFFSFLEQCSACQKTAVGVSLCRQLLLMFHLMESPFLFTILNTEKYSPYPSSTLNIALSVGK